MTKVQINLVQKHLFLHQLTHNMTKDCSLNYKLAHESCKLRTLSEHAVYINCSECQNKTKPICVHNMFWACSFMCWTRNSVNNLLSYFGLVAARISASDKDLPVNRNNIFVWFLSPRKTDSKQPSFSGRLLAVPLWFTTTVWACWTTGQFWKHVLLVVAKEK